MHCRAIYWATMDLIGHYANPEDAVWDANIVAKCAGICPTDFWALANALAIANGVLMLPRQ